MCDNWGAQARSLLMSGCGGYQLLRRTVLRTLVVTLNLSLLGSLAAVSAVAQQADNLRNSRPQIESAIAEAQKIVNSPGYSARIKQVKRQEIALLKSRLDDGDLQPGDQIFLSVDGEQTLTNTFTVSGNRSLTLPGVSDVSLRGVLRSELEQYLTNELKKYLRNPVVHVRTTVRMSILGSVAKPGFYQVESEKMIGDAIMLAGGPSAGVDPAKTRVERSGAVILDRDAFTAALNEGKTLDQMNLRAGDEIVVGGGRTATTGRSALGTVVPVLSGLVTMTVMLVQIF